MDGTLDCGKRYLPVQVGDTAGLFLYRVLQGGKPLSVEGVTVGFRWVDEDGAAFVDSPGIVVDAPDGVVGYQRVAADVVAAHPNAVAQFTVTFLSGDPHVSPVISAPLLPNP